MKICLFQMLLCVLNRILFYCQAQGPTLGPTQGRVKVKVKVRSDLTLTPTLTQKWDLSYTLKLVFTTHHSPPPPPPPSLNECLVNFVILCDTL